jgi:predicted Rossmann-fold nucleotide-binding protein
MPGSIGTLTELAIAWNEAYLAAARGAAPVPILAFRDAWSEIVDRLTGDLRTTPGMITMMDSPAEAVAVLLRRIGAGAT